MNNTLLNNQDIDLLKKSPDVKNKSSIAQKVGNYYNTNELSPRNRLLAESIFRLLIRDTEVRVRQVLAETLKNSNELPKDIVETIINDRDTVAIPFIQYYKALSDEDLINLVQHSQVPKQKAVTQRKNISTRVSSVIAENCSDEVVTSLVSNNGADISNDTFISIINNRSENEAIKRGIVHRNTLPFEVIEQIVSHISYKLKTYLVLNHNLPQDFATNLINEIKEKLTLKLSEEYSQDEQIRNFVQHLYRSNRLTYSLVTRSICSGDLMFFEQALSILADLPVTEVRKILFSSSADFEVRNLLRQALLPKSSFSSIFSALKVIKDVRFDCGQANSRLFSRKIIERILSYNPSVHELSREDLYYLLSQIS